MLINRKNFVFLVKKFIKFLLEQLKVKAHDVFFTFCSEIELNVLKYVIHFTE